jgi:hypothetical protein
MNYETISNSICSNNEIESSFYVFEIIIYTNNNIETYRKISYSNEGLLVESDNNIKKIKITMCRINNINNIITIRKHFNNIITKPIVLYRDNLIITICNNDMDNLIIKYQVL